MRTAIREKFQNHPQLKHFLVFTHPHPMLSIKADTFLGFDARKGGENMLAKLLMELRSEMMKE